MKSSVSSLQSTVGSHLRQQAIGSRGIFDFRFSIVDLIIIRKSQFANPSDFTDFMDFRLSRDLQTSDLRTHIGMRVPERDQNRSSMTIE